MGPQPRGIDGPKFSRSGADELNRALPRSPTILRELPHPGLDAARGGRDLWVEGLTSAIPPDFPHARDKIHPTVGPAICLGFPASAPADRTGRMAGYRRIAEWSSRAVSSRCARRESDERPRRRRSKFSRLHCLAPRFRQVAQKRIECGGSAAEKSNRVVEIVRHFPPKVDPVYRASDLAACCCSNCRA